MEIGRMNHLVQVEVYLAHVIRRAMVDSKQLLLLPLYDGPTVGRTKRTKR